MRIIGAITSGQQTQKQSVEYYMSILLFENIRNLYAMLKDRITDVMPIEKLGNELNSASDYLKHTYASHLDTEDDTVHNTCLVVVGKDNVGVLRHTLSGHNSVIEFCEDFLKSFQVVENVRAAVRANEDGLKEVLGDANRKLKLFYGHQLRYTISNEAIDDSYLRMQDS